jgi:hypothetical protein
MHEIGQLYSALMGDDSPDNVVPLHPDSPEPS